MDRRVRHKEKHGDGSRKKKNSRTPTDRMKGATWYSSRQQEESRMVTDRRKKTGWLPNEGREQNGYRQKK